MTIICWQPSNITFYGGNRRKLRIARIVNALTPDKNQFILSKQPIYTWWIIYMVVNLCITFFYFYFQYLISNYATPTWNMHLSKNKRSKWGFYYYYLLSGIFIFSYFTFGLHVVSTSSRSLTGNVLSTTGVRPGRYGNGGQALGRPSVIESQLRMQMMWWRLLCGVVWTISCCCAVIACRASSTVIVYTVQGARGPESAQSSHNTH